MRRITTNVATAAAAALFLSACDSGADKIAAPETSSPTAAQPVAVVLDATQCAADLRPLWVGFQDGAGAWKRVEPTAGGSFATTMTEAKGALAVVLGPSPYFETSIRLGTKAELAASPFVWCTPYITPTRTAMVSVVGLAGFEAGRIALGGGSGLGFSNGPVTIRSIPAGTHDLFAWRTSDEAGTRDRLIVRRGLNPADGGALAPLDFDGAEAVTPASALMTVTGFLTGEIPDITTSLRFQESCAELYLGTQAATASAGQATFMARGVPTALQRSTDFHTVTVSAESSGSQPETSRYAGLMIHALAPRTIALPAPLGASSFTRLAGSQLRAQLTVTVPAEFDFLYGRYSQAGTRSVTFFASAGYYGAGTVSLTTPDLAALPGWNPAWALVTGGEVNTSVAAWETNGTLGQNNCFDGSYIRQSSVYWTSP